MDIYSYFNSKTVGEYCRSIGHQFNAMESAFIINDCKSISMDKKTDLFFEIMNTMPDVHDKRITREFGDVSFFYALREKHIHDDYLHALSYFKKGGDLVYSYGFLSDRFDVPYDDTIIYSSYEKALDALKADICKRDDEVILKMYITARKPDTNKYIKAYLTPDFEINELDHNYSEYVPLFDLYWVYIPTPFKKGDILIPTKTYYTHSPIVLNGLCYQGKDDKWFEERASRLDSSDMTAYGYMLDDKGYLYEDCVHDYHNLEYFTGELCKRDMRFSINKDKRLLKAVSESLKGNLSPDMLILASDYLRNEREFNDLSPRWDYTDEYYEQAGISDILKKRRMWDEYDNERYGGK